MARILVAFHSRTGHTQHMAEAIVEGARKVAGTEAEARPIAQLQSADLIDYDGIVLGSATYYGTMSAELKKLIDDSISQHGQLIGKVAGAFASSGNVGGGNETTVLDILHALMIHGMVVQGLHQGDHFGPVAIGDLDDRSRAQCLKYGQAIAELAVRLHG